MPSCLSCGSEVGEYDSGYYSRNMLCIPCYTAKASEIPMVNCGKCGMRIKKDEARSRSSGVYCNYCYSELERVERLPECAACGRRIESWQQSLKSAEGKSYHADCLPRAQEKRVVALCSSCWKPTEHFRMTRDGKVICSRCSAKEDGLQGGFSGQGSGRSIMASIVDRVGQMIG